MRKLLALIFCATLAFGADEIKRPTTDNDPGSTTWATNACGVSTYTANSTSGALAYDAAGQSTSVTYSQLGTTSGSGQNMTSRKFQAWQSATQTYTSLTLNFNTSSPGANAFGGASCLMYSLNSGSTWTTVRCDAGGGWTQTTDTVTLSAAQNLSNIQIGICVAGVQGGGVPGNRGQDSIQLYDFWTDGVYTVAAGAGTGNTTHAHRPGLFI